MTNMTSRYLSKLAYVQYTCIFHSFKEEHLLTSKASVAKQYTTRKSKFRMLFNWSLLLKIHVHCVTNRTPTMGSSL